MAAVRPPPLITSFADRAPADLESLDDFGGAWIVNYQSRHFVRVCKTIFDSREKYIDLGDNVPMRRVIQLNRVPVAGWADTVSGTTYLLKRNDDHWGRAIIVQLYGRAISPPCQKFQEKTDRHAKRQDLRWMPWFRACCVFDHQMRLNQLDDVHGAEYFGDGTCSDCLAERTASGDCTYHKVHLLGDEWEASM